MEISDLVNDSEGQQVKKIDEFLRTRPYSLLENLSNQCDELFTETNQRLSITIGSSYPQILRTALGASIIYEECSILMNNLETIKKCHRSLQKTLLSQPIYPVSFYKNNDKILSTLALPLSSLFQTSVQSRIHKRVFDPLSDVATATSKQSLLRIFFSLPQTILEALKNGDVFEVCYLFLGLSPFIYNTLTFLMVKDKKNRILLNESQYASVFSILEKEQTSKENEQEKQTDSVVGVAGEENQQNDDSNHFTPEQFELIKRQIDYFQCYDVLERLEQTSIELLSDEEKSLPTDIAEHCCLVCDKLMLRSPVLLGHLLKALTVLHTLRVLPSESNLIIFFIEEREKLLKRLTTKTIPFEGTSKKCELLEMCFTAHYEKRFKSISCLSNNEFQNRIVAFANRILTIFYIIQGTLLIVELLDKGLLNTRSVDETDKITKQNLVYPELSQTNGDSANLLSSKEKELEQKFNEKLYGPEDMKNVVTQSISLSQTDLNKPNSECQESLDNSNQLRITCNHEFFDKVFYSLFDQFNLNKTFKKNDRGETPSHCDCRICTKRRPRGLLHVFSDGVRLPEWVSEPKKCESCCNKTTETTTNLENRLWSLYLVPIVQELFEEIKLVTTTPANLKCCDIIWRIICARLVYLRLFTLQSLSLPNALIEEITSTEIIQNLKDLLLLDSVDFEVERVEKLFHVKFCQYISAIYHLNESEKFNIEKQYLSRYPGLKFFEKLATLFSECFSSLLYQTLDTTFKTCFDSWFSFKDKLLDQNTFLLNKFKSLSENIDVCVMQLLKKSSSSFRLFNASNLFIHHFQINRTIALSFCETLKSIVEVKCAEFQNFEFDHSKTNELLILGLTFETFCAVVYYCSIKRTFSQQCLASEEPMSSLIQLLTSVETFDEKKVNSCLKVFVSASIFFLNSWITQILQSHVPLFQKNVIEFFKIIDEIDPMLAPTFVCSTYSWTFVEKNTPNSSMPTKPSFSLLNILFNASHEVSKAKHMQRCFLIALYKIHAKVYYSIIETLQLVVLESISTIVIETYKNLLFSNNLLTPHTARHCALQALFDLEVLNSLSCKSVFGLTLKSLAVEEDKNKVENSTKDFIEIIKNKFLTNLVDKMLYESYFNISVENYIKTQALCLIPLRENFHENFQTLNNIWKSQNSLQEYLQHQTLPVFANVVQPLKLPSLEDLLTSKKN